MNLVHVTRSGGENCSTDFILQAGKNLQTGERDFVKHFGQPTSLEKDLLLVAASVFAVDRSVARGEREDQNRHLRLSIPVANIQRLLPLKSDVEDILRTLSHDDWRIDFRQDKGSKDHTPQITHKKGSTLLFSGGLDSLAAAIEFGSGKEQLQLVSHITRNRPTRQAQDNLYQLLCGKGYNLIHRRFMVSASSTSPSQHLSFAVENSQRTRSFLFVTLGALSAMRNGNQKLLMIAENGQMAVHLPLNPARAGAFSTHTAHPEVLIKMEAFFRSVLEVSLEIVNPYQHKTKAEVVKIVRDGMASAISISTSCWMNAHLPSGITHCGSCIPCIIRRIAIEIHGKDSTAYNRDLFSQDISLLGPEDDGRRNLYDLVEFNYQIEKLSPAEIGYRWPELLTTPDSTEVIKMYKRAAAESRRILQSHSKTSVLLR